MITYFRKYKFNKNDLREGTKIYIGITRYLKIAIVNIARGKIVIDFTVHEEQSNKKNKNKLKQIVLVGFWPWMVYGNKSVLTIKQSWLQALCWLLWWISENLWSPKPIFQEKSVLRTFQQQWKWVVPLRVKVLQRLSMTNRTVILRSSLAD